MSKLQLIICWSWLVSISLIKGLPDLRENSREPIRAIAGQEAILSCNVKNLENNTVIWKRIKNGRPDVLTAGIIRVTSDVRFAAHHTKDSPQWLLSINPTRVSDTAQYVCEVNSSPAVRLFLLLTVTVPGALPLATPFSLTHNFTECCVMKNVPDNCLGFCSLRNIVLGITGSSSHECEDHLASIAFCMADGKNHEPCCIRERVPEACREVCRGEYTLQTASVLHHYTCSHYSSATLACIAQGVELLPPPPLDFVVEPLSDREIKVKWKGSFGNNSNIEHYILNITELKGFDELESSAADVDGPMGEEEEYFPADGTMSPEKPKIERQGRKQNFVEKFTEIKINSTETSTVLKDLKPYTMYEIYIISVNQHGSSLPTYRLRALTLLPESDQTDIQPTNVSIPDLPDIRGCCVKKGLPMENCVDRFCDPKKTDEINLTDMMICAPWVSITLPCLTQGKDHTPCCIQRGLPNLCINLCHGNISRIDYQYFQCLPYMPIFANCLMEGYGVLTSAPKDLRIQHVSTTYAILQWQPPEKLAETVLSYNVHYRSLSDEEGEGLYTAIPNTKSPYLLNGLKAGNDYEVYVRAVNEYGVSQASPRALFKTEKVEIGVSSQGEADPATYNMTECCAKSGVNEKCLPMCNLRAKLSEVKELVPNCLDEMHKMLRCGAGGRNHVPCCQERQVRKPCLELCAGVITQTVSSVAAICVPDLISIVECLEQGTDILPGPVTDFQVIPVNSSAVYMEWKPPTDSNVTSYEMHYRLLKDDNASKVIPVNTTNAAIGNLDSNSSYVFFVVSVNDYGTSIASSLVHLNLSVVSGGEKYQGTPSPPESVSLQNRNTTSLTIVWLPPAFTHPLDHLRYKLYYRSGNQTIPNSLTTTSLGAQLNELTPNTKYEIYTTALTDKGESPPGELIEAWTDVALPAYVETPHIHPSSQVVEGSNLTVLCVAMGNPVPTISFFVNGILYAQQKTRNLVAVITNVTRSMAMVVCYAENGYGLGMQSSRRVYVSSEHVTAIEGQQAVLTCLVNANPEPHMSWWKDIDEENKILNGEHYLLRTGQLESGSYSMHLAIINVTKADEGTYYCHSQNPFGRASQTVTLQVDPVPVFEPAEIKDCCISQRVSPECMDACTYDINFDAVSSRSRCISEIHKLMYCAADGSDHRRCCLSWGVPRRCIGWCQGRAIHHGLMCTLGYSKQIIQCFQEGRNILPGPPQNIQVQQLSTTVVKITWDPPEKNPQTVDFYRILWKKVTPGRYIKEQNDTRNTSLMIYNMVHGASYEVSIRAFNSRGSSISSTPVALVMNGEAGIAEGITHSSSEQVGLAVGLVFAIIIIALIAVAIFFYFKRRNIPKLVGGVSFENPTYMKDGNSDTVQITNCQDQNGGNVRGDGWKHENSNGK
ncbi:hypothetical protein CHUAL_001951 [Chamberlinius hualienensis]